MRAHADRAGFTLAELAATVLIVGILAALVIPNVRGATLKADAASIVADAHNVSLAAHDYLNENGRFPMSSGYGMVPAQLAPYLPANYQFNYQGDVLYAWFSFSFPNTENFWQTRSLGLLVVNYATRPELAEVMRSHQSPSTSWGPSIFIFIYPG